MERAAVSGSCARCGCALSYLATRREDVWLCCGPCAGSDRCGCGCDPVHARERNSDLFVPTRRMFASRHPDELRTPPDFVDPPRAFPFAEPRRGR